MASEQYYQSTQTMAPRPGKKYSTTYYKQSLNQRRELAKHFNTAVQEIADACDTHKEVSDWLKQQDKRFKRDGRAEPGQPKYKTPEELMIDILKECNGTKKDGLTPKDFAQAPIDRWNRLFAGTKYEVDMVQQFGHNPTSYRTFNKLFEQDNTPDNDQDTPNKEDDNDEDAV
jgi:gas vesicle protein